MEAGYNMSTAAQLVAEGGEKGARCHPVTEGHNYRDMVLSVGGGVGCNADDRAV
jgi:hypothetical protein